MDATLYGWRLADHSLSESRSDRDRRKEDRPGTDDERAHGPSPGGCRVLSNSRSLLDPILFCLRSGRPHRQPETARNHLNQRQRALSDRGACCAKVRPWQNHISNPSHRPPLPPRPRLASPC
jgi:hypothetical protein